MAEMIQLPKRCGNWKVIDEIGRGAYGIVYLAENGDTHELNAVKVIRLPGDREDVDLLLKSLGDEHSVRDYYLDLVSAFDNEIKTLEQFKDSGNIVRITNSYIQESREEIGWVIFIFMEYLNDFAGNGFFDNQTESDVIKLGIDVCNALDVCEQNNIIHRDLKPDNILVDNDGNYKVCDFGVAKKLEDINKTNTVRGTFEYMAPEIYHGQKSGHRADIYSLGMIMYRMMNNGFAPFIDTGKQMLLYSDREQALVRRMSGEAIPKPLNGSDALAEVILKACAYMPEDRYESASRFREDLISIRDGKYKSNNRKKSYKKHIEARIVKKIAAGLAGVVVVTCILGLLLPNASNCLWYNPAPIIEDEDTGENIHQFTEDMQEFCELKIPEMGEFINTDVEEEGWGKYKYTADNEFRYEPTDAIYKIECSGEIKRNTSDVGDLMVRDGIMNSLWLSKNVTPSITGIDNMKDDEVYCAYVTLDHQISYEELYDFFDSEGPEYGMDTSWLWCGVKVSKYDNNDSRDMAGFYANLERDVYTQLKEPDDAEKYFTDLLDKMAAKKNFLKLWNEDPETYKEYSSYVKENKMKIYGLIYIANKKDILKLKKADNVNCIVVEKM